MSQAKRSWNAELKSIGLSAGTIEYRELGSAGPTVVFVHGALVDGSLWKETAEELSRSHRCLVPTWPLGSHRQAMRAEADLSPVGVAHLIVEFLEALDLDDVTLVGNDSGGAISQCVMALGEECADRVSHVVLTNCDAFEEFPPKAFRYLTLLPRVPGATTVLAKELYAFPFLARLPIAFGRLVNRSFDTPTLRGWFRPAATDPAVRRDLKKLFRGARPEVTLTAAETFSDWHRPVLLVWGNADPFFRVELAERLCAAFPQASLERIPGGRTFVMWDEPREVARRIRRFLESGSALSRAS